MSKKGSVQASGSAFVCCRLIRQFGAPAIGLPARTNGGGYWEHACVARMSILGSMADRQFRGGLRTVRFNASSSSKWTFRTLELEAAVGAHVVADEHFSCAVDLSMLGHHYGSEPSEEPRTSK